MSQIDDAMQPDIVDCKIYAHQVAFPASWIDRDQYSGRCCNSIPDAHVKDLLL
jgi:hypothetical protein